VLLRRHAAHPPAAGGPGRLRASSGPGTPGPALYGGRDHQLLRTYDRATARHESHRHRESPGHRYLRRLTSVSQVVRAIRSFCLLDLSP